MTRNTVIGLIAAYVVTVGLALLVLARSFSVGLVEVSQHDRVVAPIFFGGAAVVGLAYLFLAIGIGVFVYHDAAKHGMAPVVWTIVAVLVPYFIGFVAYLVARQSRGSRCGACGEGSPVGAAYCPRCGQALAPSCRACGRKVPGGALYCPACGAHLGEEPPTAG